MIEDFVVREPDSIGSIWFDGEVRNLGPGSARVQIVVKAYSINEVLLDSKSFYPDHSPIAEGQSSHFHSYVQGNSGEVRKVIPQAVVY